MSVELNGEGCSRFFLVDYEITNLFRDAWDRFRSMTKEQAMVAYIDEIRKVERKIKLVVLY